ncbi:MAG: type II toxin-antitoxin system HipA family toxin [Bacteroidales bacterium]|nr:type II toxin-antitoxin system HipA family toxin [Candidatus Latescibacterota bacterium]
MSQFPLVKEIKVGLNFGIGVTPVGRFAMRNRTIYFEYDSAFIDHGLEISPLRLPLDSGVSSFENDLFEGLPGVFNDSLPDGWGRLLFDRLARSQGIVSSEITPLDRLANVGMHGMGALVYEPDHSSDETYEAICLDTLAEQTQEVLHGTSEDVLQELLTLNGSSAGTRPKALVGIDQTSEHLIHGANDLPAEYAPWLVKFANSQDDSDAGAVEYVYAQMAKGAGIQIPDVHLFPAQKGTGYFSIKRFDRDGDKRYHMHTACGLLHSDFRTPSLDYEDLIALTGVLTRDVREVEKMYRLAVFNVLAHNRDDHAKNFSFLMDADGQWKLSPAYDLTFSSGPGGEQSTMVMGEGRDPGLDHLTKLGLEANLNQSSIEAIIEQTRSALAGWKMLAKQYGVSRSGIELIAGKIL